MWIAAFEKGDFMADITQMQRDILYQSDWILHSRIEILNRNFKIIHYV